MDVQILGQVRQLGPIWYSVNTIGRKLVMRVRRTQTRNETRSDSISASCSGFSLSVAMLVVSVDDARFGMVEH